MKYLCLIYLDEEAMNALPPSEWNALIRECIAYSDQLQASHYYLAGDALESVHTATTVRWRNGKLSATDGPFAETKEQLAGYCLLEARDLNEAIQLASKLPPARYGGVEVRPIRELEESLVQTVS
ncbi:YciI family protein [Cellvibrio sp. PSBB006]|uniref:YciI family protein n=1 Tax=Cellvibrio sp. PSBB006 TaxID=1987723 RepID=UPI000B3B6B1E|nr:YciI family protein [Cellvibrio sp. PSBB006]ARU29028.1 dehydrogenase [Cellvibrio sp. PSBB006]